ncbi:hypothetical protein L1987_21987 [Smallanthus sonchifolius]|uniref:Uncharacterized protein n=1 Tax=Smallanthus sonchifolius TaxID=185202 RepID=A0ACB9IF28_9ASTR|nr:hypothetical protein L1987_21987 [Smallanthus sonchifolius]
MGCFLGCFSSSKDRKRRKHRYRAIRRDQDPKSQNLVQADVSLVQSIKDKPCDSLPELRGKNEEPLSLSKRKKVTFDTNVTTYEHVQVYDSTESLLEKNENGETFPKSGHSHSGSRDGSDILNVGPYPPNYRYGNCLESDDEIEDSDYEDENDDDLDDEEDYDDQEVWRESILDPISSSESRIDSSLSPVLKPVENLAQWKALKSTGTVTQPPKPLNSDPQKENFSFNSIPFPPKNWNQETAVDASLNWLVSAEKNSPNNKRAGCYSPDLEPVSSGKSFSQESTITSVKSIEDRPILGALTADELKQFSGSSFTPRKSPGRSPDDMPIIGSVGSYWSHTGSAQSLSLTSSYKGIPNATSKYREDKKVNWQNTPFETRLERALNGDCAEC